MNSHAPTDHGTGRSFMLSFGVLASGIVTTALGFLALLGWVLRLPLLAGFGVDLMPMAPSTAVLFLLYGAAVCLRTRLPLSRRVFWISVTAGCLGALVALLLFTLGCLDMQWPVENLGLNATRTVRGAPIGHMSPVTAFCFLVVSVSFLISLSLSATRPWRTALAFGSAGVLLGACFIFLLAYLYGAPLLYGGRFIPPALNTILAFAMLGLALLTLAGRPAGLFGGSPTEGSRTAFPLVLIFALLAAGIVATGYIYYRHYEQHYRAEAEHELSAIAELKVSELTRWREERMADGALFSKNPSFSALVRRFFAQPADADAQRQLLDWLGKFPMVHGNDQFRLMDAQGVTRLSVPGGLNPATSVTLRGAAEVLRSGQIAFQDFYRHERNHRVYLQVMVPILDEQEANRPLGVLVLRLDPTTYLYPFIQRWPIPSQSAETLLVRREGNEAVFLNELRFQTNSALSLRAPLARKEQPAVMAALGREGIVEGRDYRSVRVIAAVRAVPDSPWFLVARRDTAEVYAPLRERLWLTVFLAGVLLISAGAGAGLLWRQQRLQFYQERAQAAEALRTSEHRFRSLFDSSRDAVMTLEPPSWKFTSGNPATVAMFGARNAEHFVTFGPWELSPERQPDGRASTEKAREMIETAMREGSHFLEWTYQRINGQVFLATVLLSRMEAAGKVFLQATIRDITEHKQAEAALRQSEARYRAVADSANDAIITADGPGNVVGWNQGAERIFGYTEAEILGQPLARLMPHGYRDPHAEGMHRAEAGGAPPVIGKTVELEGLRKDGSALPLELSLADWQTDAGHFYTGIIRDITERKRTEDKLRQLSRAVEQSPASIVITDPAGNIEYVNPRFVEVTGYTLAEVLGKNPRVLKSGDRSPGAYQELWQTITAGKEWRGEFDNKKKNGERYWESASISPIRDIAGRTTHYVGVKEDITARKQTEAERDQLIQDLQKALANVKSLSGLLPICAGCKKIRDDTGYWSQVESYVQKHSEATFTHGLCPDCIKKYYPELDEAGPGNSPKET